MEAIHLILLLATLISVLDRYFFQRRLERIPDIADFLSDPRPILADQSIFLPGPTRPLAVLALFGLAYPLAILMGTLVTLGPVGFLLDFFKVKAQQKGLIEQISFVIVYLPGHYFFARMFLGTLWFPTMELTRDELICRLGRKSLRIPWVLLDCYPREPWLDKSTQSAMILAGNRYVVTKWVLFEADGKPREPWAPEVFPIKIIGQGTLAFENHFAVNQLLLARFLAGVASIQVTAGHGLTFPRPRNQGLLTGSMSA